MTATSARSSTVSPNGISATAQPKAARSALACGSGNPSSAAPATGSRRSARFAKLPTRRRERRRVPGFPAAVRRERSTGRRAAPTLGCRRRPGSRRRRCRSPGPRNRASSWRISRWCSDTRSRHLRSPRRVACPVEATMSVNSTMARTRSGVTGSRTPVRNSRISATMSSPSVHGDDRSRAIQRICRGEYGGPGSGRFLRGTRFRDRHDALDGTQPARLMCV